MWDEIANIFSVLKKLPRKLALSVLVAGLCLGVTLALCVFSTATGLMNVFIYYIKNVLLWNPIGATIIVSLGSALIGLTAMIFCPNTGDRFYYWIAVGCSVAASLLIASAAVVHFWFLPKELIYCFELLYASWFVFQIWNGRKNTKIDALSGLLASGAFFLMIATFGLLHLTNKSFPFDWEIVSTIPLCVIGNCIFLVWPRQSPSR